MKKSMLTWIIGGLLMSSCGTYTGEGAATGAAFGSILGSAIGGISGGWRGHDIGTVVGMAGGAVVGAAIGAAADQKEQQKYEEYQQQRAQRHNQRQYGYDDQQYRQHGNYDDSGFDASNSGDDRISFDGAGPRDGKGGYTAAVPHTYDPTTHPAEPGYSVKYNSLIEICNARFIDADHDGIIRAGEECRITFEIMNRSSLTLYDVQPTVFDVSGNKHIHISPNLHIESIAPNKGVRYTATVLADNKLGVFVVLFLNCRKYLRNCLDVLGLIRESLFQFLNNFCCIHNLFCFFCLLMNLFIRFLVAKLQQKSEITNILSIFSLKFFLFVT